jgi:D-alanyl-D-alanine carboxypeptidase/D-alanyl-D-alanine carboxypeptidase (penicillin-binding protein 5/6)
MLVIEAGTGAVVYSKNADARLPMASTTKIMTALVVLENSSPDSKVTVSANAAGTEGSSMYLRSGEVLTVRDLLYGLMLSSGNDAANALAEFVGGSVSNFVALMNETAKRLGLENTNFTNPSGLPDNDHYTTATELAKITAHALKNTDFVTIVSTKSYTVKGEGKTPRTLTNHNKLLSLYDGCIGVKTGFTKKAGRCLVSAASRGEVTLVCVTLNAPDDWDDHIEALDVGFSKVKEINVGSVNVTLETPDGQKLSALTTQEVVGVGFENSAVTYQVYAPNFIYAPANSGDLVGYVDFLIDNVYAGTSELRLASTVECPQVKELFITRIINFFKNIFR